MRTAFAVAALAGAAAARIVKTYHGTSHVKGCAFDRYVVVYFENTDFDKAAGDPNFAWLAQYGITLTNYFGVTHPSQPNYVASVGGDHFGMDNDEYIHIAANVSTVMDLLEDKKISWSTYQEDMPYTGFQGEGYSKTDNNDYVRKHHPAIIYEENNTPHRLPRLKNFKKFYQDLEQHTLPQYVTITPNMTNDGHDSSVTVAGQFLRRFFEPLLENEYFMKNTLILVTFDESHSYHTVNRVFSVLLGGAVPQSLHNTTDDHYYNHYSEIATVEANWKLHTLGRWDVGANVYDLVAKKSGDIYRPNPQITGANATRFQRSSYAGPWNLDFQSAPYPGPNVDLVTQKTCRTVLPAIKKTWKNYQCEHCNYYTDTVVVPDGDNPPQGYAVNPVEQS